MNELTVDKVERLEELMLQEPQVECPVRHIFGPGVYIREVTLPADTWAIGHHQNFEHMNIMLKGKVQMFKDDGTTEILEAPLIFVGKPGRKIGYIIEEVVWQNVYGTTETNVEMLEGYYLTKSPTFMREIDRYDYRKLLWELGKTEDQVKAEVEDMSDHVYLPEGSYKFKLAPSQIEGNGIFATESIQAEELIGQASIEGKRTILGRRVNHSINPNSLMIPQNEDVLLYAIRDINVGEELTIDYRFTIQRRLQCQQ